MSTRAQAIWALRWFLDDTDPDTPVLAMGDFNDEPFDTSLVTHALSTRQRIKVVNTDTAPRLWNLLWPVAGTPRPGTFYFDNQPNLLDQFLVNKNLATQTAPIRALPDTVGTLIYDDISTGTYHRAAPRRHGQPSPPHQRPHHRSRLTDPSRASTTTVGCTGY